MVKISVIVPVYNVDRFLSECLESILSQNLSDIEVICVDDGSTDNSLNILTEYQQKDERIKIISQENRGLAAARNRGMDAACGEYIMFVDSDDYITSNALETLYDLTCSKQVDFTMFKLLNFDNETRETSPINYFNMPFLQKFDGETFNHHDVGERLFNISVTAPGKLFRRDFIDRLRFPEDLLFEDTPFVLEAIFMADKMYFLDEYMYMRRIHKDSITHSNFSGFSDCIIIFNMMADITKRYGEYEPYKEKLFTQKVSNTYTRFMQVSEEYKSDFFNKIKADFSQKQIEFEDCIDFRKVKPRAKQIYYSALNSKNHKEFEKSVKIFDNDDSFFDKLFKKIFK